MVTNIFQRICGTFLEYPLKKKNNPDLIQAGYAHSTVWFGSWKTSGLAAVKMKLLQVVC